MYNLEPEEGSSYLYKIEGEAISVNQYNVGNMVFLRIEKEDVPPEEVQKLQEEISKASGIKRVVILPPWVNVLRVSPMVQDTPMGKIRKCIRCGGNMRELPNGGLLCFSCGNETPGFRGGEPIELGGMS